MKQQHQKSKLRQVNVAVLGPYAHGKSSLVKWLTGKNVEEYQSSMVREHHYLFHHGYHINLFDLPADTDYVVLDIYVYGKTISNSMTITNVIFVVCANPPDFAASLPRIKQILQRCELLNVKRILFAINFMDGCLISIYEIVFPGCNWSRDHYNSIVGQLQTLCSLIKYKSDALQTAFVPTSSLNGENIQRESPIDILVEHGVCRWMVEDKVPSFIQCFEEFIIDKGKTPTQREQKFNMKKKPLRLTVIGRILSQKTDMGYENDGNEPIQGVLAYIHSGKVRRDTQLLFQPQQIFTVVKRIAYFTGEQQQTSQYDQPPTHASAGSLCYIYFHNEERLRISIGSVGGETSLKKIPQLAETFLSKVKLMGGGRELNASRVYDAICGLQKFKVRISDIQGIYDNSSRRLIVQPKDVKNSTKNTASDHKVIYQMRFMVLDKPCLERYTHIPTLGQVFLFNIQDGQLLALGRIDDITLRHNGVEYLPRVFAVPRNQLLEPNGEHRCDWDVCQIDLDMSQDTLCLPCGHLKMCESCSKKMSNCPFCKMQITKRMRMQPIMMEQGVALMEFALCDKCMKNKISHAIMDCSHYQCLCEECVQSYEVEQSCLLCNQVHLISRIFI